MIYLMISVNCYFTRQDIEPLPALQALNKKDRVEVEYKQSLHSWADVLFKKAILDAILFFFFFLPERK